MSSSWRLLFVALLACETSGTGVAATVPVAAPNELRGPAEPTPGHPIPLPAKLVEGRFFVEPVTQDGQAVSFYTDTGGGLFFARAAADRLGLAVSAIEADGQNIDSVLLPAFAWDAWIPPPEVLGGRLPIRAEVGNSTFGADGLLGQGWFKGRVWTFDYGDGQLFLRAAGDLPKHESIRGVPLYFAKTSTGERGANYPRITVKIDGEAIDLLFDTGATATLSSGASAALADGRAATRATSFIVTSIFDKWARKHSDWRVLDGADAAAGGEPMIEVPAIEVAGYSVGPVWFTRRADKNFHDFMSQYMDKRVEGALGGSALKYFRVHVDYPRALAVFEKL